MGSHLLVGSGGETGRALMDRLAAQGERVIVTSHRPAPHDSRNPAFLSWNLETPSKDLEALLAALGDDPLSSLSLFAHPSFQKISSGSSKYVEPGILPLFSSLLLLFDALRPRLREGSSILFFFPSLSRHRTGGYLSARLWIGALHGLFGELSRNTEGLLVTGIETLISPDRKSPHLPPEFVERIAVRTSRGRLATAAEIADFASWLILSKSPLFHGQILRTEGGPYF